MLLLHPSPRACSSDPATPAIYTLSLHDALPISAGRVLEEQHQLDLGGELVLAGLAGHHHAQGVAALLARAGEKREARSEEHTSELQSLRHLVCRLLLEKKKRTKTHVRTWNRTRG